MMRKLPKQPEKFFQQIVVNEQLMPKALTKMRICLMMEIKEGNDEKTFEYFIF